MKYVTRQYNLVPAKGRWFSAAGEVTAGLAESMAAYRRVDDLRSPAGWLLVHRDRLGAQRSVSSMGKPLACLLMNYAARILVCSIAVSKSQEFLSKVRWLFVFFRQWRHCLHVDASEFFRLRHEGFDFHDRLMLFRRHCKLPSVLWYCGLCDRKGS